MKSFAIVLVAAFAITFAARAHAQGAVIRIEQAQDVVTLVSTDKAAGTAAMRNSAGSSMTLAVRAYAHALDGARPGDTFQLRRVVARTIEVGHGCAAGTGDEVSLEPAGEAVGAMRVVHATRLAVCVVRVHDDGIDVLDSNGEIAPLVLRDASEPIASLAEGDTIVSSVREVVTLSPLPRAGPSGKGG